LDEGRRRRNRRTGRSIACQENTAKVITTTALATNIPAVFQAPGKK
jgi:hypothetical protein